jgi:hypothetical protein
LLLFLRWYAELDSVSESEEEKEDKEEQDNEYDESIHSVARFRLRVHTLRIETAT